MLHSLMLILDTEVAETQEDHLLWRSFCQEDGLYKLEHYLNSTNNKEIQRMIESILDTYKG